jgi:hypothetical protein
VPCHHQHRFLLTQSSSTPQLRLLFLPIQLIFQLSQADSMGMGNAEPNTTKGLGSSDQYK